MKSSTPTHISLRIVIASQTLDVIAEREVTRSYSVSTSKFGVGEVEGTYRTPRGWHLIRAKIGAGQPKGAVFRGRRATGEIYSEKLADAFPNRDWILTRILWLSGTEVGRNRLANVDTMRRYIYIHGTPDSDVLGVPGSMGCIRMSNDDIVELFDMAPLRTPVEIV